MEYTVNFRASGIGSAVTCGGNDLGYDGVKKVRDILGLPKLGLDRIHGQKEKINKDLFNVKIPEKLAVKCKGYKHRNSMDCYVREGYLSKYAEFNVECKRDEETDEITKATLTYKINYDAIVKDWAKAGYPHKWNIEYPNECVNCNIKDNCSNLREENGKKYMVSQCVHG